MADETQYDYTPSLDEIVFEKRNKEYGAYDLRNRYPKILTRAFLVGTFLFILMVLAPFIVMKIQEMNARDKKEANIKLIDVLQEDKVFETPPEEEPPPPPPPPEKPPEIEVIQNVVPEPTKTPKVETPPPPIKQQMETTTGLENREGVKTTAFVPPPPPPSTGTKAAAVAVKPAVDLNKVYDDVEQLAEFPGGLNAFRNKVSSNFDQGTMEDEGGTMQAEVTFIVDREGNVSDVKVTGKNKYFNDEAARTVKSIKTKWAPAKVNGQTVKYRYRLPIAMQF